jgi:hypothetical protein
MSSKNIIRKFKPLDGSNMKKKPDSEKWWDNLTSRAKQKLINNYYHGKTPKTISGYEIFRMWRDESYMEMMEDDDIPTTSSESIEEYEQRTGRGFWGNNTTGYINDKRNR